MIKNKFAARILCTAIAGAIALISLTGCSFTKSKEPDTKSLTPEDYEPGYYLSEESLPENAYYIKRDVQVTTENKDGTKQTSDETRYYPLLAAANTFDQNNTGDMRARGYDSSRLVWVNYNLDEGKIPTMYAGDQMIYKSSTYIPTKYNLEKFFDDGYTLGLSGLSQDLSGNYKYLKQGSHTMPTSDAIGFDGLEAETIYLAAVGDTRVTAANVSPSGTITGLDLMETYPCDIRTGTEQVAADLTCNIHAFSSAETYVFGSFTFITKIIAQINIPEYVTTGYYEIGNAGFFRYIADDGITDYRGLDSSKYNETIYTYGEEGNLSGTTIGYVFDENDFLIKASESTDEEDYNASSSQDRQYSYSDTASRSRRYTVISNPTSRKVNSDGSYSGSYKILDLSTPTTVNGALIYDIEAKDIDNGEIVVFRYRQKAESTKLKRNGIYSLLFREAGNSYDGYEILTAGMVSEDDVIPLDTIETVSSNVPVDEEK